MSWTDVAKAWSCPIPGEPLIVDNALSPTGDAWLRRKSQWLAQHFEYENTDPIVTVVGQFSRTSTTPFLHETLVDQMRAMYWPLTDDVQMPMTTEFTYQSAYSFEGHKIEGTMLVPFVAQHIRMRIAISADYGGIMDTLPRTESMVIGILHSTHNGKALELVTSFCPTYFPISPEQLSDFLECKSSGECP
ncbi:hypothetical protein [Ascidiaceihabitans sp.]|uniref:hypothetical protein n=1 Tax=Ascidiaceihabitans sp. TaxID=1872644 RepID=UPI003297481A